MDVEQYIELKQAEAAQQQAELSAARAEALRMAAVAGPETLIEFIEDDATHVINRYKALRERQQLPEEPGAKTPGTVGPVTTGAGSDAAERPESNAGPQS